MEPIKPDDPETQSKDIVAENIAELEVLYPEAFTENKVDFEVLKQLLGDSVDEREEKYGLNWHGKRRARQLALTPSSGTLRPSPEDSVDWETTQNLIIEGDNLEVLKLLQKSYTGKVKLIYIDPPYNTGNDFVYPDNFRDSIKSYLELTGQVEGGRRITTNTEASGRFHTDWLNMMYPRLKLARALLRDDGAIFVSIDDTELGNLMAVLSEIFGEENFQANISWQKRYTRSNNTVDFTTVVEHILVFSKTDLFRVNLLERTQEADDRYSNSDSDPRGLWKGASLLNPASPQQRPNLCYPIENPNTGQVTEPTTNAWRRSREEFERLQGEGRLYWGGDGRQAVPSIKMFLSEARNLTPINFWDHVYAGNTDNGTKEVRDLFGEKVFDNPKPLQLLKRVIEHATDSDSLVLDFFAGSGTTGHAVMSQNAADNGARRYILVQLPEVLDVEDKDQQLAANYCRKLGRPANIAELTKERLRRAGLQLEGDYAGAEKDLGFRVFKLATSNIRSWQADPDDLEGTLLDSVEHIEAGRSEADILYEIMLRLGLELCIPVERREIACKDVYAVGGGVIFACLAEEITPDEVEAVALGLAEWHLLLSPAGDSTCIFRDGAFADDVVKTNLVCILQQHGITTVRSL